MRKFIVTLSILLILSTQQFAQISNVKLDNNVYNYLSILSQKGIIEFDELIKPVSRRYVAEKLLDIENKLAKLTKLQKQEFVFYKAEYGHEIEKLKLEFRIENSELESEQKQTYAKKVNKSNKEPRDLEDKSWEIEVRSPLNENETPIKNNGEFTFVEKDKYNRWRPFNYNNSILNLNANPILGYQEASWEGERYGNLFLGINFNGEIGNVLGFNFELKMTRESPRVRNFLYNSFSRNTKIQLQLSDSERLEYSTVNADIGVDWNWGSFTIGKNHLNWGYAENGKIVFSSNAPSFPYLRLDLKPAEWFSFNYVHSWLNSDVIDTSSAYSSWRVREWENTDKQSYISKYFVMHSLTLHLIEGVDFSIGESVVYSDNFQFAYLIPILFFDLIDEHLNGSNNYSGGSTQLFLALNSKNNIPNTHLYGSFHADELTPEGLFDPATQYYKFAFTLGGYVIDLPIENLGVRLEYTKVYPGNYRHFISSLTYESSSSLLGHWIGDNGDILYAAFDYTILRGLKFKLWTQMIRKGTEAHGNRAYRIQKPQPPFLFTDNITDRKNYFYFGIDAEYEFLHDVWVKAHYQYIDFEQQFEKGQFKSELFKDFSISFGYGI